MPEVHPALSRVRSRKGKLLSMVERHNGLQVRCREESREQRRIAALRRGRGFGRWVPRLVEAEQVGYGTERGAARPRLARLITWTGKGQLQKQAGRGRERGEQADSYELGIGVAVVCGLKQTLGGPSPSPTCIHRVACAARPMTPWPSPLVDSPEPQQPRPGSLLSPLAAFGLCLSIPRALGPRSPRSRLAVRCSSSLGRSWMSLTRLNRTSPSIGRVPLRPQHQHKQAATVELSLIRINCRDRSSRGPIPPLTT